MVHGRPQAQMLMPTLKIINTRANKQLQRVRVRLGCFRGRVVASGLAACACSSLPTIFSISVAEYTTVTIH